MSCLASAVGIPSAGRDAAKVGKEGVPVTDKGAATFELIKNAKLADTIGYGCGKGVVEVIDVLLFWQTFQGWHVFFPPGRKALRKLQVFAFQFDACIQKCLYTLFVCNRRYKFTVAVLHRHKKLFANTGVALPVLGKDFNFAPWNIPPCR